MSDKRIPFAWIVHGYPSGHQSNATYDDTQEVQNYHKDFQKHIENPSSPGEKFIKETLANGDIAYTVTHTGIYESQHQRPGSNYAAITVFISPKFKSLNETGFEQELKQWFTTNILNGFTVPVERRGLSSIFNKSSNGNWRRWHSSYRSLFEGQFDAKLTASLEQIIQKNFEPTNTKQSEQAQKHQPEIHTPTIKENINEKTSNPIINAPVIYASNLTRNDEIVEPTIKPNDKTNWVLTKESAAYRIVPYEPAYGRILGNPSRFLDGAMWQGNGKTHIEIQEPGKAIMESDGKLRMINKPEIRLSDRERRTVNTQDSTQRNEEKSANTKKLYSMSILDGQLYRPKQVPDEDTVFEMTETSPGTYEIDIYQPAYKRILANPSFLDGCQKQVIGDKIVKILERGIARDNGMGKLIVEKAPEVHLLTREMAESQMYNTPQTTTNDNQTTNDTLYADFIDDGTLSHVTQKPNDDTNFVLTKQPDGKYKLGLYEPAYPRILRNPAAFLQGTDKQVIGRNIVKIKEFGVVREDATLGKFTIEKKLKVHLLDKERQETLQNTGQPNNDTNKNKLYSMTILDGQLHRPKPVPNEDTVFELTETSPGTYEIDIYQPAYKRILANPSFLDGCQKQVIGDKIVKILERGIAKDNGTGKLIVEKAPVVHLLDREMAESRMYTQQPTTDNSKKISDYNNGKKMLEDEIAKLEKEIREKQQLLEQKRAQLAEIENT